MNIPFTDFRLLFSPRWSELSGVVQGILLVVLCLAPAVLMIWLYRYELNLVRRVTALALLALRLAVLVFLLFVLCLQPVVARVSIVYGTVALGPDDSVDDNVAVMDDFIYGEPQAMPYGP